jgi:hypothetical protein
VIGIGEDVKNITKEIDHILLEELVCNLRRGACKVVDQVECDYLLATSYIFSDLVNILLRPRSAISRIVCLTAQRMESLTSLN